MPTTRSLADRVKRLEADGGSTLQPVVQVVVDHGETLREVIDRDYGGVPPDGFLIVRKMVEALDGKVAPGYVETGVL